MHPVNERQRYNVTSSLIGWTQTQNDPLIPDQNKIQQSSTYHVHILGVHCCCIWNHVLGVCSISLVYICIPARIICQGRVSQNTSKHIPWAYFLGYTVYIIITQHTEYIYITQCTVYISIISHTKAHRVWCHYNLWCHYNKVISPKSSQNTSHSSSVRARYGMYFVGSNSDLYSDSVTAVMYAISCYIRLHNNGTWLYLVHIWGLLCQKQVSSNYIPQYSLGCNYLFMS